MKKTSSGSSRPQKILVFQQKGSGEGKIAGVKKHGGDLFRIEVVSLDMPVPGIIDNGEEYLPDNISADLVLDFLKHPDLSNDLHKRCEKLNIPVIASGKKTDNTWPHTPPT